VWNDDVETVGRAPLEDYDQALRARTAVNGSEGGASKKTRDCGGADYGDGAVAQEYTTGWHKKAPGF
jgi:hypothetical protein